MAEVESGGGRTVRMSPDELPDPGAPSVPSSLPDPGEPSVSENPGPNAMRLSEPGAAGAAPTSVASRAADTVIKAMLVRYGKPAATGGGG